MAKSVLSGKIKCGLCSSNMRAKTERNKTKFICSKYSKNSSDCVRIPVEEEHLLYLIQNRYGEISDDEIRSRVDCIEVFEKLKIEDGNIYKLTIYFHDDEPIILGDKLFQF